MGRELQRIGHQSGKIKDIRRDMMITALYPGKRISHNGIIYWETRKNRSDLNKARRL